MPTAGRFGRQLSSRRGSVQVSVDGDEVRLSGHAVTVGRGSYVLPEGGDVKAVAR